MPTPVTYVALVLGIHSFQVLYDDCSHYAFNMTGSGKLKLSRGSKVSSGAETRQIEVGVVVAGDKKKHNKIKTSKYTLLMFLPKNLSEQFRRVVNFYFLVVTVVAILIDSPVSPLTSIAPLTFMVLVTAVKQGYEDWLRHKTDNKINNQKVEIVKNNVIQEVRSSRIAPGTLVRVKRGKEVPADLVLLCSASEKGKCYVTTANLDGEANLKTLRVPQPFIGCSADILPQSMRITVNNPEANLYTFQGSLKIPNHPQPLALTPENLMLRGSRVRNTEWAIGCAVYTGEETKLALNSKFTSNKFSSCELAVNAFLIFFIILLVFEMTVSLVAKVILEVKNPERQQYLGPALQYSTQGKQILQDLLSFLLLYYYIIPMSLYVTIELYKFIGSLFIRWDEQLRCPDTGKPAVANTSDLNEELGQVEVLFSDKTGTLTKNMMVFKACSVRGTVYEERNEGFFDMERPEMPVTVSETDVQFFFTILALCHSVQISDQDVRRLSATLTRENKQMIKFLLRKKKKVLDVNDTPDLSVNNEGNNRIEYHASSPDEKALVEAADRLGVTFLGEDGNNLLIKIGARIEMYERLQIIEFTSDRRRMSIILRDKDGKIWLFCKGAESAVMPLCKDSAVVEEVNKDIDSFANKGLRTLAVAYREIPQEEYDKVSEFANQVEPTSVKDLEQMALRFRELEKEMTLLGATAVEDCLQEGVADTLAALRRAGIKIWVLTGDKVETAINVAQSCAHISENDRRLFMIGVGPDAVQEQLDECQRIVHEQTYSDLALVVDGATMGSILDTTWAAQFADVSMKCNAVLCCRLSPIQKAKIVKLIKNTPERPITAAIGDGANDISMIQEAHVGFGIFGKEGYQAARSADFAFTRFSMVKRMLLVLGHWYYQRLATLIHYFFYKNIVLGNIMFIFQIHAVFSTQSIYNSMYLTLYNFFFTTLPCLILSLTEQRWPADLLMWNPTLYREISRNHLMSSSHFMTWILTACYHSFVIYVFTWLAAKNSVVNDDGKAIDLWCFGAALFHLTIVIVNLKLWMQARYQTYIFIISILATIFIYMAFDVIYSLFNISLDGDSLGVYLRLLSSPYFWFLNLLAVVAALAPDYCARLISDKWGKRRTDMKVIIGPKLFITQL
ncbi:phospholipid-transporting ATPase IF-like isoform X2 [Plodia interpunctella]|uniref:phospholipid-transporting ATPase IF-like isoform X2 n=1 Tax=Plodia interpunctella TaxID=58824 RepID=UPI002367ADB9|nr:phospholipid-transporting ATPase IF-like isoform X2 [Plodia interpunctella]